MAIKNYARGSQEQLSKNFKAFEFQCPSGCSSFPVDEQLVVYLQTIRNHFGASVNITNSYRCPEYNAKAGGSKNSYHMKGMAADIWVEGYLKNPREVARYAESIGVPGIGLYEGSKGMWFVHIDTRPGAKCRWEGHAEIIVPTFFDEAPEEYETVSVQLRVLRYGMKGEDVAAMQALLNANGYNLEVDKSFGPATKTALESYQAAHGLAVDATCGPATWNKLLGGG